MKKCKKRLPPVRIWAAFLTSFLVLLASSSVSAQTPRQGVVTDKDGRPVAGATVTIKGGSKSVVSAENGSFTIPGNPSDILVISFVGYENYEVRVGNKANINVQLALKTDALNDVVVVGYDV